MASTSPKPDQEWESQYDCDTLQRAADIMKDPDRLARAKNYAVEKAAKLRALVGGGPDSGAESSLQKGYRSVK